jgi:hypothetical protein
VEELKEKMNSRDLKALKELSESITDGYIPRPLSQIMKESA